MRRGASATTIACALIAVALRADGRAPTRPAAGAHPAPPAAAVREVARAWPVMGTMFTARAWGTDSAALLAAVRAARDSVRLVDSLMSVYRPTSDVSRVNAAAGRAPVVVAPQTLAVLSKAGLYWRLSGGAFDPTVAPLVRAWGFYGLRGRLPGRRELDSLRALVGYGDVAIDSAARTVRLPRPGMALDLGGIAKGYALDRARAAMRRPGVTAGALDLGGNVLVFGRPPRCAPAARTCGRWPVAIVDPRDQRRTIGTVWLDSGAVATSGDYEHFYLIGGRRYAHLIDPRTGRPARGVLSATAVGPLGEWSDGLSATLFLVGPARGLALADSLAGVMAVYVVDRGRPTVSARDVVRSTRARSAELFSGARP